MSVTTCVQCDAEPCSQQLHYDPMQRAHEWHLPDGWLSVIPGDTQLHSSWHFCSLPCLDEWLSLRVDTPSKKNEAPR